MTGQESLCDARERVIVLREGEDAPKGKEIVRILATGAELLGPGTNYRNVYTVAVRDAEPLPCEARELRLAQALRLLRDTSGEYVGNVAQRALDEAGIPEPPEEDHP